MPLTGDTSLSVDQLDEKLHAILHDVSKSRELEGLDPDTAFSLGYQTCIHDVLRLLRPQFEFGLIEFEPTQGETND